tara:strand:- start:218 stop:481 length:264 start_codon:yes stop_codon:yes gene_type:complete
MCIFRAPKMPTSQGSLPPISKRNPDLSEVSQLPEKRDLVDEDDVTGVEYGSKNKATSQSKAQGAKALRIKLNTGVTTGGVNAGGTTT